MKNHLQNPPVLSNFDPNRKTELHTDASRTKGLGYVLMQEYDEGWKIVSCGSRFITETERRYSMVELEMLAAVWALKKCRVYLLGMKQFNLIVDHKPLESILDKKTMNEVESPRLQRLKEKLLPFGNFRTIWRAGKKHLIADAFSRAPTRQPTADELEDKDQNESYVKLVR